MTKQSVYINNFGNIGGGRTDIFHRQAIPKLHVSTILIAVIVKYIKVKITNYFLNLDSV